MLFFLSTRVPPGSTPTDPLFPYLTLFRSNHYDHIDMPTLKRLWERDRPLIVTGLGNDTLLARNGIPSVVRDWGGRVPVKPGVEVIEGIDRKSTRLNSSH